MACHNVGPPPLQFFFFLECSAVWSFLVCSWFHSLFSLILILDSIVLKNNINNHDFSTVPSVNIERMGDVRNLLVWHANLLVWEAKSTGQVKRGVNRSEYKIAVLAYRHFDGTLAPYLSNVLSIHQAPLTLRSSNEKRSPKYYIKSAGGA